MRPQSRTVSAIAWAIPLLWRGGLMLVEWLVLKWGRKLVQGAKTLFKSQDRLDS